LTVHDIIVLTGCQWVSIELCKSIQSVKRSAKRAPLAVGLGGACSCRDRSGGIAEHTIGSPILFEPVNLFGEVSGARRILGRGAWIQLKLE